MQRPVESQLDLFSPGGTRRSAAAKAKKRRTSRDLLAINTLRESGASGLTREELSEKSGIKYQSICSVALRLIRNGEAAVKPGCIRNTSTDSPAEVLVLPNFIDKDAG
jgi:hypothetical protein